MNAFLNNLATDFYDSIIYDNRYLYIFEGIKNTIIIAFFAVLLGIILGTIIAIIKNYHDETNNLKFLNFISNLYVSIIRGTPVLLQLMIIYYVIFRSVSINIVIVGILAFGLNSAAYVSEIIRAGIDSIPIGQKEAGYAVGLSYFKVMRYIL